MPQLPRNLSLPFGCFASLFGKKSTLKIRKEFLIPEAKVVLPILALGVSPFIMQATESIVLISLNNQLSKYGGDLAVSAMTIISSINQIILLPLMGTHIRCTANH